MIKIILNGCNGRMGHVITSLSEEDPDIVIEAGVDVACEHVSTYPVFSNFQQLDTDCDVIVDFSSPEAFDSMMDYAVEKEKPVVICTTGLSEQQDKRLISEAKRIAVLRSANMSLGINLLLVLVREAARRLVPAGFDIEIVERHHNKKVDAPSGTALSLADSINEAMDHAYNYIFDRSNLVRKRQKNEIGISSVRGGTIPGIHEVIFAGEDEVVELSHVAYSRNIFAKGALSAAKFLVGKNAGFYTMADVIG